MNLIVNTRYNERRQTIFTSNYEDIARRHRSRTRCKVRIGFRMHSRLHEMCEFLEYRRRRLPRTLPPNGGVDDLLTMWKMRKTPAAARCRRGAKGPVARAAETSRRSSDGKARPRMDRREGRIVISLDAASRMLGLYLHIPFCSVHLQLLQLQPRSVRLRAEGPVRRRRSSAEIGERPAAAGEPADTIFFGGGTPSLLEPDEIARHHRGVPRRVRRRARRAKSRSRPIPRPSTRRRMARLPRRRRQSRQLRRAVVPRRRAAAAGRIHSAARARAAVARGARRRLRQRQPRPDDVAAAAERRRLARERRGADRRRRPSMRRSICSSSIRTRR